ncbi:MAG: phosphate acetyltransferase [Chloroflexota bacterium]
MNTLEKLHHKAKMIDASVVLPEGNDIRTLEAAVFLADNQLVTPIVVGNAEAIRQRAQDVSLSWSDSIKIVDPATASHTAELTETFFELRKKTGITQEEAAQQILDPLTYGAMMARAGLADGCVAGAAHATSDVLRAALRYIGLRKGNRLASSSFLMMLPNGRSLTYGDCGMVPDPDAEQLATIAIATAETHRQLAGETPRVAMLSFSTKGSADSPSVRKVREATALVRQMAPDLAVDGELQFDAAFIPAIGQSKAPDSAVAGNANVFIFPNLDAGNISYKITERIGGAQAIGPLIQGLAKPMHDLSRGCKAADIVTTAVICAIQAQG